MVLMPGRLIWVTALAVVLCVGVLGGAARPAATAPAPTKIYDNGNVAAVQNGASVPTVFTTTQEWKIVQIYTYHWNNAKGIPPGQVGLVSLTTGKKYGPWQARGLPGQGGVPNAYWVVAPQVDAPPGRYQITDSSPATWSQNSGTGGAGMVMVFAAPAGFTWPSLPSGLVSLASVSNGCGPGTATKNPRWGDTSTYKDSGGTGKSYTVNFRQACNLHDAGYSGSRVRDPLHGGIAEFLPWNQARVDTKFLADMRLLCRRQIPAAASVARIQCEGHGGAFSFGAASRADAVKTFGYWVFLERPRLSGVWVNSADPTEPALALSQAARYVRGSWKGGKADPKSQAEFRGTLISRDTDSIVRGYVKYTDGTGAVSLKTMTITYNPKRPGQITVVGPNISGVKTPAG